MVSLTLTVETVAARHCFVTLPQRAFSSADVDSALATSLLVLSVSPQTDASDADKVYVGWSGLRHIASDTIGIPRHLASALSLTDGARVIVAVAPMPPTMTTLTAACASADDWEMIEANASELESAILSQIQIAHIKPPRALPIFIHNSVAQLIPIQTARAAPVVRLTSATQIVVIPAERTPKSASVESAKKAFRLRTQRFDTNERSDLDSPYSAVNAETAKAMQISEDSLVLVSLKQRKCVTRVRIDSRAHLHHIRLCAAVQQMLTADDFAYVQVSLPHPHTTQLIGDPISAISIQPLIESTLIPTIDEATAQEMFLRELRRHSTRPIPISNGGIITLTHNDWTYWFAVFINGAVSQSPLSMTTETTKSTVKVRLSRPQQYFLLSQPYNIPDKRKTTTLELPRPTVLPSQPIHLHQTFSRPPPLMPFAAFRSIFPSFANPVYEHINTLLMPIVVESPLPRPSHVMICGDVGCGKTASARVIAYECQITSKAHLQCIDLANTPTDNQSLQTTLTAAMSLAITYAPSIIVLDNIDIVCPPPAENDPQSERKSGLMTEWLHDLINANSAYPIAIIGTSLTPFSHDPLLRKPGLFPTQMVIPQLTRKSAVALMAELFRAQRMTASVDALRRVSSTLDGCRLNDIVAFTARTIHCRQERIARDGLSPVRSIEHSDLKAALTDFTPTVTAALPNTKPQVEFADIGGLHSVKESLMDILHLPTLYAPLFAQLPLRLRSGVLLYGAPGSGKSILAVAAAYECGLPLIVVKGPELLNKYIGASESAVRDVFARARSCAPCVLLLDELDALAPKRGGDSSGVSDRVVNQLLCELDGVDSTTTQNADEQKRTLYVIGTSSRPEMIDAALLRPGRLDAMLHCNFPDTNERADILMKTARRKGFDDADATQRQILLHIASVCDGYTGADLTAIVREAHLLRVHQLIDNTSETDLPLPPLTADILLKAAAASTPSLSASDRNMYTQLYTNFRAPKVDRKDIGKRIAQQ